MQKGGRRAALFVRERSFRSSLRANGPREARPVDRLREAIQNPAAEAIWIASSQGLLCGYTYALKYAICVVVASSLPFGDHSSAFWSA
ncbi:hypothetical protein ACVWY3_005746 [Bradyrhizobium sp. USDA 4486]